MHNVGSQRGGLLRISAQSDSPGVWGVGYGSVHEVLQRATAAGLRWPLPTELDDEALGRLLYRGNQGRPRHRAEPDWTVVDTELRRKGVMRELLWLEYKQAHPDDGLQYTQFCLCRVGRALRHRHPANPPLPSKGQGGRGGQRAAGGALDPRRPAPSHLDERGRGE